MGLKIKIDYESVNALREFAQAIPVAVDRIVQSTENLLLLFRNIEEQIGPHQQDYFDMLQIIKKLQESNADAINELPIMLNNTADRMEEFIQNHPSVSS